MQNYEIALIINPDLSKDIDKFFTSFEKLLSDNNFSISRLEDVGRRKLAYSIDDHNKGHYLFYYVEGTPENVSEIENKIKFNDMIIRHLFVKINNVPELRIAISVVPPPISTIQTPKSFSSSVRIEYELASCSSTNAFAFKSQELIHFSIFEIAFDAHVTR